MLLNARQASAGDDPATTSIAEGACAGGLLEYQWSRLTGPGGSVAQILSGYSPDPTLTVSPAADTTYLVEARCSSDELCASSLEVSLLVYTGDGGDVGSVVGASSLLGISDGHVSQLDDRYRHAELASQAPAARR